jgi:hypothetical protein
MADEEVVNEAGVGLAGFILGEEAYERLMRVGVGGG